MMTTMVNLKALSEQQLMDLIQDVSKELETRHTIEKQRQLLIIEQDLEANQTAIDLMHGLDVMSLPVQSRKIQRVLDALYAERQRLRASKESGKFLHPFFPVG